MDFNLKDMEKRLEELEKQVEEMQKFINRVKKDIYLDEQGVEFEIECPYCENDFVVELTEVTEDVRCPECNNIIELDWTGGASEWEMQNYDSQLGCNNGECSHCQGCEEIDIEDDDM